MENERSFSTKPLTFVVFSFAKFFSLVFLIVFSAWVIQTIPSRHLETLYLGFNNSTGFPSSEHVLKNPNLTESHSGRDANSSKIATISSTNSSKIATSSSTNSSKIATISSNVSSPERESDRGVATVPDEESKGGLLSGNSTLTSFGKNISVYSVNSQVDNNSTDDGLQKKKYANDTGNVVVEVEHSRNGKRGKGSEVSFEEPHISVPKEVGEENRESCDITKGRWVWDESYPLYTNAKCPIIDEGFSCEVNGRKDNDYMKWRWQPQDCDIPRFNATKMLELLRGKRLVFVGDSLNRNQWESMLCLLMGGVKDPEKLYETHRRKIIKGRGDYCFMFEEYRCTVEFYVSHFLVHESTAHVGSKRVPTLRIDTIEKGSSKWKGADVLVFNTGHWWGHHKTKAGINFFQEGDTVHPRLDGTEAFRRGLLTWASWVDKNINPRKTQTFFRCSAPVHFSGGRWNTGGHCMEASRPLNETFTRRSPITLITEEVIRGMKTPITFLNITHLSDYRPDGHPSIYGRRSVNPGVQDCSHWCLPGVPDTWNELLYHNLLLRAGNT